MTILVSVITPILNGETHIEECLNSISNQRGSVEIEHLVIDGGSTDRTIDILKDRRDVKWISEKDSGQSDGYNKGIKMAQGEWIILLDGDDVLLPGTIDLYLSAIEKDKKLDIIYGHTEFIDGESNHIRYVISTPFRYEYLIYGLAMPPSSGLMYRGNLLKENFMDTTHHYNLDTEWYLRCGKNLRAKLVNNYTIGFRFWGQNKTSPLFDGSPIPIAIINERKVLHEAYIEPYLLSINKFYGLIFPAYFRVMYYLSKINQTIFLLFRKKV
jgi:glycosyltransferase involved in cell wall biosynthesis